MDLTGRIPKGQDPPSSSENGRKRLPLEPLSPSSSQNVQKRRSGQSSNMDNQRERSTFENAKNLENINSNIQKPCLNFKEDLSGVSKTCLQPNNTPQNTRSFPSFGSASAEQSYLTTSQRRLSGVNLSGISYQSPVARVLQHKNSVINSRPSFQLPASRITPRRNNVPLMPDKNFQESFKRDRGIPGSNKFNAFNFLNRHSQERTKCSESSIITQKMPVSTTSTKTNATCGNNKDITVLLPELEELGLPRPAWFPSEAGSGGKNLMDSFNAVRDKRSTKNKTQRGHEKQKAKGSTSGSKNIQKNTQNIASCVDPKCDQNSNHFMTIILELQILDLMLSLFIYTLFVSNEFCRQ